MESRAEDKGDMIEILLNDPVKESLGSLDRESIAFCHASGSLRTERGPVIDEVRISRFHCVAITRAIENSPVPGWTLYLGQGESV